MPVHIATTNNHLTFLIPTLTAEYLDDKWIHVCKLHHHNCSENYYLWNNGQHPILSVVYVPANLEHGIRIILNNILHYFPNDDDDDNDDDDTDDDDNDDDENDEDENDDNHYHNVVVEQMMTCPGCGQHFSEQ